MGEILLGPWAEQPKEQVSLPNLPVNSSQDLYFFRAEIRQAIQQVSIPFKTNNDICPIHCKDALDMLEHLNEKIVTICQRLHQGPSLAIILSPSRYSLIIDLYNLQKDASSLIEQLDDYRASCLKPSRRLFARRCEITTLFDKIIGQLKNIPDLLLSLEEDIEEQNQRLHPIIEQEEPATPPAALSSFKKHAALKKQRR